MKNFEKLAEIANEAKQVFLSDRYTDTMSEPFEQLSGIVVPEKPKDRTKKVVSGGKTFRWTRGRSIPRIVVAAFVETPDIPTIGVTGSEWCGEYLASETFSDAPSGKIVWASMTEERLGRLALIARDSEDAEVLRQKVERGYYGLSVVTAFPNLVSMMGVCDRYNLSPKVAVDGGVEGVADALGMPAVEQVFSGETIKKNGFQVVLELMDIYPALVISEGAFGENVQ